MLKDNLEKIDFHVHPFLENYGLDAIVNSMYKKDVEIVGLPNYNNVDNFTQIRQESKKLGYLSDSVVVKAQDKYLLRATELECYENLHLLVIGNTNGLNSKIPIRKNIEIGLKNNSIVIIDHPFADANSTYKGISLDKRKQLKKIAIDYEDEISWEWNSYCIPLVRFPLGIAFTIYKGLSGYDVNHSLEEFACRTKEEGYKINIIADSDVHARNKRLLKGLGTAHIKIEKEKIDYNSGQNIINSIKKQIKDGEGIGYKNQKDYISFFHLLEGFGIPITHKLIKSRG